ncbi:NADH dehydrogenase [ubiquinone] 1 alpha subcomplex subunit 3 [Camelus dromedarius]|uniref:NADH dehydrogenase [ubiquinone] 1 alpha subcomplex subunit 3 n=1 Tax=Camelus dromedarius TaxID=9838 RepID=A0A5N4CSU0_CAMDR|nr:NADH dehydrogenase [ubiquinone] 1 alpha subcomplex subunit 3 [Camelus dromedarius]
MQRELGCRVCKEPIYLIMGGEERAHRDQDGARITAFLKNAWAKEPVLVASFTNGNLAIILPTLSPCTKYAVMINWSTRYKHPVPGSPWRTSCYQS